MAENFNRRSTDNQAPNSNTPEWLQAVTTLAPIALTFFQMLTTMLHSRPPKKSPTSKPLPLEPESSTPQA